MKNTEFKGVGFVLLENEKFDFEKLRKDLKEDFSIAIPREDFDTTSKNLVSNIGDNMLVVSFMPAPVPNGEAAVNAQNNYTWKEAVKIAEEHKAHLIVSVLGKSNAVEKAKLFVNICASCLKQKTATGLFSSGTVWNPEYYRKLAQYYYEEENFPIMNLIYFGFYHGSGENRISAYTFGLRDFEKSELEIIDSQEEYEDIYNMLSSISEYILTANVELQDGETIGLSAEQKLLITKSKGIALEEETLKIKY